MIEPSLGHQEGSWAHTPFRGLSMSPEPSGIELIEGDRVKARRHDGMNNLYAPLGIAGPVPWSHHHPGAAAAPLRSQ